MVFISKEAVKNLTEKPTRYIFKVDNRSISESYVLNYFWAYIVANYIPNWVAPNLITTCGALSGVLGFIVYLMWAPMPWALVTTAVLFFIYQTLDGW